MNPEEHFVESTELQEQSFQSPDISESTTESIMEIFPNYAEDESILEETNKRLRKLWSDVQSRDELEAIWEKNDEMFRVKPDPSKDDIHRANEATGVFHISVNQLVSMAFKTFTDNPENYKYSYQGITDDEVSNQIRSKNAEIMNLLLHKALSKTDFKKNLKRVLLDIYKNGIGFISIPWEKRVDTVDYRDKTTGKRQSRKLLKQNLPGFEFNPVDKIWLDENLDDIESQPAIFIEVPISWTKLLSDSKKNNVQLFDKEDQTPLREKLSKYLKKQSSVQSENSKSERMDNADRSLTERTGEQYQHYIVWINLPIDKENKKWDEEGSEIRCRVRILGDPGNCQIIEIRENIFPGGIPFLVAHQTEDDIGIYHTSLGEKVKTYYDQICIAIDQLIDNRSKNCRRSIVVDPMRVDLTGWDFGHSNVLTCQGDVRSAVMELQIADMTATIMTTITYCEQKVREIMNTTESVLGQAMGGRTSASEYMGAKVAATTPIFSDMASIEDALIGEYMRRFTQYIHTFMTHEDIIDLIGIVGAEFTFDLADIYTIELHGVAEAMNKAEKIQNLLQLYNMSQDVTAKSKIMLRIAEAMGVQNPAEFVSIPAKDQAIKAALWENNEMLVFGEWDEPESGEMHDIHIPIHRQALWQAEREPDPNSESKRNAPLMRHHIATTEQLKRRELVQASGSSFTPIGQESAPPPTPGQESGQSISAEMGNLQAGSPIPAEQELAMPVG